jgi:hypothetical protein
MLHDTSKMELSGSAPSEIACGQESMYCTAGLAITPNLLVVWTVWDTMDPPETAAEMANRQGAAIVQLVQNGLGQSENFDLIGNTQE